MDKQMCPECFIKHPGLTCKEVEDRFDGDDKACTIEELLAAEASVAALEARPAPDAELMRQAAEVLDVAIDELTRIAEETEDESLCEYCEHAEIRCDSMVHDCKSAMRKKLQVRLEENRLREGGPS